MQIGVSLFQFFPGRVGGAGEYVARLIPSLCERLAADDRLVLCGSPENLGPFDDLHDPRLDRLYCPVSPRELQVRRLADLIWPGLGSRKIARLLDARGLDVLLCPQQCLFPHGVACPAVVTVVDLLHEHFPEQFSRTALWLRIAKDRQWAARAAQVICISEATRQDVLRFHGMSAERAMVVHLGGDSGTEIAPEMPTTAESEPYVFYPANAYPHKNHTHLVRSFLRYCAESPNATGRLVMSGQPSPALLQLLKQVEYGGGSIEHRGYVTRAELTALYAGCRAVVFPSRFEGFGIPIVEAMAHGKPIVCSNLPVFHELAGSAVRYVDPTSERKWAAALADLFQHAPAVDRAAYAAIRRRLNWTRCGEETYDVLHKAVHGAARRRAAA